MTAPVLAGIALLGGGGALLRHVLDASLGSRRYPSLPLGILTVNLSGAFAIGVLAGTGASAQLMRLLGTGLLGGYTTFSAWMLGTAELRRSGRRAAAAYLCVSLLGGLVLVWAGRVLGRAL